MKKIVIFGNSGSGKTTLAREFSDKENLPHLDLDSIAWKTTAPPERKPMAESRQAIDEFIQLHDQWVIEGCYADLLEMVIPQASEIIYLNLPVDTCIANAKNRPWEPHKYPSKAAQDANLNMLIDWIGQYTERADTFSSTAHRKLYAQYKGQKTMYTDNQRGS